MLRRGRTTFSVISSFISSFVSSLRFSGLSAVIRGVTLIDQSMAVDVVYGCIYIIHVHNVSVHHSLYVYLQYNLNKSTRFLYRDRVTFSIVIS